MNFFSMLFAPPQTKAHMQAARSATKLREQAVRDLYIELKILNDFHNAARRMHQRVYETGNMQLAEMFALSLEESRQILDRIERTAPGLAQEIEERSRAANSAADFEKLASFEIELRTGFLQMRDQAKQLAANLIALNSKATQSTLSSGGGARSDSNSSA